MPRQELSRGKHPTADDLTRMRLGYSGYEARLESMRRLNPARYAAVMTGAKTFNDPHWNCAACGGAERYTRNLTCRTCNAGRRERVFKRVPGTDRLLYVPDDTTNGTDWHRRRQRNLFMRDAVQRLNRLGRLACGRYYLETGRIWASGSVQIETEPLMLAVEALLSGELEQSASVMRPIIEHSRDLALLVREIATRLNTSPKRSTH